MITRFISFLVTYLSLFYNSKRTLLITVSGSVIWIEQKKLEQLADHNKRFKLCIKWFQRVEENSLLEQEKLRSALECSEKKCNDTGKI